MFSKNVRNILIEGSKISVVQFRYRFNIHQKNSTHLKGCKHINKL